ncbi:hypothetical protein LEP1GSC057_2466 [Leptospira interrogans str. Brem 329]|nr:hypothetical protein LEP1GSC057_2466 [Leptospira interrogans str. Brem 329]
MKTLFSLKVNFFVKKIDVGTTTNRGFAVGLCKLWELL